MKTTVLLSSTGRSADTDRMHNCRRAGNIPPGASHGWRPHDQVCRLLQDAPAQAALSRPMAVALTTACTLLVAESFVIALLIWKLTVRSDMFRMTPVS